ncbi:MAG TPA: hypothetical protein VMW46_01440 [Candidatus Desulfaltia sp.]|nr:hypothetical protein [Candidatus Desulfaltia sp.]
MKVALVQQHASPEREDNIRRGAEAFREAVSAPQEEDFILYAECDLGRILRSFAKRHFLRDRRPGFYRTAGLFD